MISPLPPGFRLRVLLRGLVLIATLVAVGFLIEGFGFRDALDTSWIDSQIRGKGLSGDALFVVVGALFAGIGLPRQAVCFLGGYAFGFAEGVLWSSLASVLGCIGAFYYARFLGRSLVVTRFPERIARLDAFLAGNTFSMSLLLRLLPVGSNLLANLAGGVSGVRAVPFFLGSALGYLPQTLVFVLLGSGIQVDPVFRIGSSVILFIASGVLGVWLYRRYRHGRRLDAETEAALDEGNSGDDVATRSG
ncbi:TVP38/TMEM64 family protein [Magnetospirillum molischianum]|uniref:TVP38/TMEM64 family membrane protein n=1 Tax=Magnetospirillum molischianum DSM 120 TaxID=1150626 RepID=H8FPQ0_MAGML|nr:VTT domain-containing protein [Magnetospirillum molischianum]CCG40338.1 conserved membrane hypothetical protein [Magnetospirillum molischianum DSM 120]